MKAVVLHEYGGPSKLHYENFDDPQPGPGEVRIRVLAVSINPIDWKMRSGAVKDRMPIEFPAILGRDFAGIIDMLGEGVKDFQEGDKVFGLAVKTYAELCVVKTADVAKIPDGLDMTTAGAVPLIALTGDQLVREATQVKPEQTILLTGATGSVGRCALFAAREIGAKVIAGVRKKHLQEAINLGAVEAIDLDDEDQINRLGLLDGVADTVGGRVASKLLGKVRQGGVFGSVVAPPEDAALHPTIQINRIMAHPAPATVLHYGQAVRDGHLAIPVEQVLPLAEAAHAQATAEKGGVGKIVLTP